ncbi:MAG TPA: hypothetical protein DD446_03620 [Coprococcus sp.]|nr:hypothetical protein [Coprococcus sp.]HBN39923.1 hypothetical protein [Coprococcus sp.]
MTARPIRYQRQVSDRKGKIFYTSITSLSHISKQIRIIMHFHAWDWNIQIDEKDNVYTYIRCAARRAA